MNQEEIIKENRKLSECYRKCLWRLQITAIGSVLMPVHFAHPAFTDDGRLQLYYDFDGDGIPLEDPEQLDPAMIEGDPCRCFFTSLDTALRSIADSEGIPPLDRNRTRKLASAFLSLLPPIPEDGIRSTAMLQHIAPSEASLRKEAGILIGMLGSNPEGLR